MYKNHIASKIYLQQIATFYFSKDLYMYTALISSQVYLSSRRGAWIVPRTAFWGLPADMIANSRVVFSFPMKWLDWCVQVQANFRIDHDTYGLRPQHGQVYNFNFKTF